MFIHKYELFKIEQNKTITEIFTRFSDIIYDLKGLDKSYTNNEFVHEILKSFSKTWETKVMQFKRPKTLTLCH